MTFHTVSGALDCVSILRLFQFRVTLPNGTSLPSVFPAPNAQLPMVPDNISDLGDAASEGKLSYDLGAIDDKELEVIVERIRSHPQYGSLLQRVRKVASL